MVVVDDIGEVGGGFIPGIHIDITATIMGNGWF